MTVVEKVRKQRSDKGVTRRMPRDIALVEWLEEMKAVHEEDMRVLLGRLRGKDPIAASSTSAALRRLRDLGLVQVDRVFAGRGRYVQLTRDAALMVGARDWRAVPWTQLEHTAQVAKVRLWLETKYLDIRWESERRIRQWWIKKFNEPGKTPDGVIHWPDGRKTAVEVELSDKGIRRTAQTAMHRATIYDHVVYALTDDPQLKRTVLEALRRAEQEVREQGGRPDSVELLSVPTDLVSAVQEQQKGNQEEGGELCL